MQTISKKLSFLLLPLVASVGLFGCSKPAEKATTATNASAPTATPTASGTSDAQGTVTIKSARGDVQLPANPAPIVVYDMTVLQNLAGLEVAVAGMPPNLKLDNLKAKNTPESKDVGTLFEPNMETLNALQPKAIFIGSRMAEKFDQLNQVGKTVDLTLDTKNSYEASKQQLADLGKLFNKTEKAQQLQQDIDNAIAKAKQATQGKGNGLVLLINGNKMSAFGSESRFGFLHTVFGIPMADKQIKDDRHGQPVSFEYLQKINPDWLFVLDRTSAVGEEGVGADKVLDNPLVHQTKAWKNKQIVYLSPDSYLAFGGYYQWLKDAEIVTKAFGGATATPMATASTMASTPTTTASSSK